MQLRRVVSVHARVSASIRDFLSSPLLRWLSSPGVGVMFMSAFKSGCSVPVFSCA